VCLSRSWHALKWKELIDVFSASTQNSSCLNVNLPNPPNKCQTSIEQHKMKPPSLVTQAKQTTGNCLDGRRNVRAFRWCHRFGCAAAGCCSGEVLQNSHFLGIPLYVNDLRLTLGLNMDGGRAVLDVYRNYLSFGIYELRNCESI